MFIELPPLCPSSDKFVVQYWLLLCPPPPRSQPYFRNEPARRTSLVTVAVTALSKSHLPQLTDKMHK